MFYHFNIVFNCLFSHCFINMLHGTKLITQLLTGLVLECV